ncbi:MAG: biotin/lipoyl-binding protein [Acidobacteria bacterium]|nr:biotin/lipoyl-binding protein [Acidobacteriota bacterium]
MEAERVKLKLKRGGEHLTVALRQREPLCIEVTNGEMVRQFSWPLRDGDTAGRVELDGRFVTFWVTETRDRFWVTLDGETIVFEKDRGRQAVADELSNDFTAPMPGRIVQVAVVEGAVVRAGDVLVVMEAMKMEHRIEAPTAGKVTALRCKEGELVEQGYALLDFEAEANS